MGATKGGQSGNYTYPGQSQCTKVPRSAESSRQLNFISNGKIFLSWGLFDQHGMLRQREK